MLPEQAGGNRQAAEEDFSDAYGEGRRVYETEGEGRVQEEDLLNE